MNKKVNAELWTLLSRPTAELKLEESEKKDKYLDLARLLKKTVEHESYGDSHCNWCVCKVIKGLIQRLEDLELTG